MRAFVIVVAALSFPPALFAAAGNEPDEAAADSVLEAIRHARGAFRAPSEDELARAKAETSAARDALAAELALAPNGDSRSEALGLGGLAEQLGQAQADLPRLEALARQFEFHYASFKGPAYDRLRAALTTYLQLVRSAADPQAAEEYERRIEQLEQAWQAYSQDWQAYIEVPVMERAYVHPPELTALEDPYAWLVLRGQATALTGQVRAVVSHPNHVMDASDQFLDRAVARDMKQPIRSDEVQDGTRVRVRGELKNKTGAKLEDDSNRGAVRVEMHGHGDSKVTARKGKVTVYMRGTTKIEASEVVNLSEQGTAAQSPKVSVRQDTRPYAVSVNMRCRLLRKLVGKLACRAAWKQKPKSDRDAAAKTRRQVDEQMRQQTGDFARGANLVIEDLGVFALLRPNPSAKLKVSTEPNKMRWKGEYASATQFAAPNEPPKIRPAKMAAAVQFHESAFNNSELLLAGKKTNEADFRELVFEKLRLVPDDDDEIEGQEQAEITLADHEPVTVRFDEDVAHLTLRLSSVRDRGETFDGPPWIVRAVYVQGALPSISIERESLTVEPAEAPQAGRVEEVLSRFLVARASWRGMGDSKLSEEFQLGDLRIKPGWLVIVLVPK